MTAKKESITLAMNVFQTVAASIVLTVGAWVIKSLMLLSTASALQGQTQTTMQRDIADLKVNIVATGNDHFPASEEMEYRRATAEKIDELKRTLNTNVATISEMQLALARIEERIKNQDKKP